MTAVKAEVWRNEFGRAGIYLSPAFSLRDRDLKQLERGKRQPGLTESWATEIGERQETPHGALVDK